MQSVRACNGKKMSRFTYYGSNEHIGAYQLFGGYPQIALGTCTSHMGNLMTYDNSMILYVSMFLCACYRVLNCHTSHMFQLVCATPVVDVIYMVFYLLKSSPSSSHAA